MHSPGDKVFAKIKGYTNWPARINPLPPEVQIPKGKLPVFFYGTYQVSFVPLKNIVPYENYKEKYGKPKANPQFMAALKEIETNPSIFMLGEDSRAESFLSQFYEFKRFGRDQKRRYSSRNRRTPNSASIHHLRSAYPHLASNCDSNGDKDGTFSGQLMNNIEVEEKEDTPSVEDDDEEMPNDFSLSQSNYLLETTSETVIDGDEQRQSDKDAKRMARRMQKKAEKKAMKKAAKHEAKRIAKENERAERRARREEKRKLKRQHRLEKQRLLTSNNAQETDDSTNITDDSNWSRVEQLDPEFCNLSHPRGDEPCPTSVSSETNSQKVDPSHDSPLSSNYECNEKRDLICEANSSSYVEQNQHRHSGQRMSMSCSPTGGSRDSTSMVSEPHKPSPQSNSSLSSISDNSLTECAHNSNSNNIEKSDFVENSLQMQSTSCFPMGSPTSNASEVKEDISSVVKPDSPNISLHNNNRTDINCNVTPDDDEDDDIDDGDDAAAAHVENEEVLDVCSDSDADHPRHQTKLTRNQRKQRLVKKSLSLQINKTPDQLLSGTNDLSDSVRTLSVDSKPNLIATNKKRKKRSLVMLAEELLDSSDSDSAKNQTCKPTLPSIPDSSTTHGGLIDDKINTLKRKETHPQQSKPNRGTLHLNGKKSRMSDEHSTLVSETSTILNSSFDPVTRLSQFCRDLKTSLIRGHEDFKVAVDLLTRLRAFPATLTQLAQAWDLMDCIKKCRRYKLSADVREAADCTFRHFQHLQSIATKEELAQVQALITARHNRQGSEQSSEIKTTPNKMSSHIPQQSFHTEPSTNDAKLERDECLTSDLDARVDDVLSRIRATDERMAAAAASAKTDNTSKHPPTYFAGHVIRASAIAAATANMRDEEDVEAVVSRIEQVAAFEAESEDNDAAIPPPPPPIPMHKSVDLSDRKKKIEPDKVSRSPSPSVDLDLDSRIQLLITKTSIRQPHTAKKSPKPLVASKPTTKTVLTLPGSGSSNLLPELLAKRKIIADKLAATKAAGAMVTSCHPVTSPLPSPDDNISSTKIQQSLPPEISECKDEELYDLLGV